MFLSYSTVANAAFQEIYSKGCHFPSLEQWPVERNTTFVGGGGEFETRHCHCNRTGKSCVWCVFSSSGGSMTSGIPPHSRGHPDASPPTKAGNFYTVLEWQWQFRCLMLNPPLLATQWEWSGNGESRHLRTHVIGGGRTGTASN